MAIYGAEQALDAVNGGGRIYGDRQRDYANNFVIPELLAANADKRTRALYNDLQSPAAIMQQLKAAGLSPSVYAAKAAGGSVPSGSQGHGSSSNTGGTQQMLGVMSAMKEIASVSAEIAKTKAETDFIKTQNEKTQQEIPNVKKQGELIDAQTLQALTQAGLNKASTALTTANTEWQNLLTYIQNEKKDFDIKQAEMLSKKTEQEVQAAYWAAKNSEQDYQFNKETFKDRMQQEKAQALNLLKDLTVKQSNIDLNAAQMEKLEAETNKFYDECARGWVQLEIENASAEARNAYIKKQTENYERTLQQVDKRLRIENRNSWFNNINQSVRTICYAAGTVSGFMGGGKPSDVPLIDWGTSSTF